MLNDNYVFSFIIFISQLMMIFKSSNQMIHPSVFQILRHLKVSGVIHETRGPWATSFTLETSSINNQISAKLWSYHYLD